MTFLRHLPSFPTSNPRPLPALPTSIGELGPEHGLVFSTMHMTGAVKCFETGVISPPSELALDPDHVVLGYPDGWKRRLREDMPAPYRGKVADAVGLTVTPHTLAAFGSYSPLQNSGATPLHAREMAVAIVALDLLIDARLAMLFSDRSPTRSDAVMSDIIDLSLLPWDRIRKRKFSSREGDPLEAARYEAEVLVYGRVPLEAVRLFAVYDERAAARLEGIALSANRNCPIGVVPSFFFGR